MMYGGGFGFLVPLAITVWLVVFTVLVLQKLDKVIELLSKK
ncbi:MAG: hypothetical protein V1490_00315 [Candidatus Omnitrophota bacterium]